MKFILVTFFTVLSLISFGQSSKNDLAFGEPAKSVKFFPNPAISVINFEFANISEKGYALKIFNFVGKKVFEVALTSDKTSVPLAEFYRGVYIFQVTDKSGRLVQSGKFQVSK